MADRRLLVLDMDNTLYDWRAHFCHVFEPLVAALADLIGENATVVKHHFRTLHRDEGHMEWASAIRRLPSVACWVQDKPERNVAINQLMGRFVEFGRTTLRPYPGVEEALSEVGRMGWAVAVFTESPAIAAAARLRAMNLSDKVDAVYGAQGSGSETVPSTMPVVELPAFVKPAPESLCGIVNRHGSNLASTFYVGDSLTRDMPMARAAGVIGIWARYGSLVDERHREIIAEVSCWAGGKVNRELGPADMQGVHPDIVIDNFAELLTVTK